eukprot:TRINITY_DN2476_c0_g1_i1.p1 TRINITY_DN2476_c0_g1~~TRINITY_DN2476_c0_g1_i1.p1  ORF type:complete len:638 (-),score=213.30 TRINITY_DN2476_c0_g1_i1:126-2039(-)
MVDVLTPLNQQDLPSPLAHTTEDDEIPTTVKRTSQPPSASSASSTRRISVRAESPFALREEDGEETVVNRSRSPSTELRHSRVLEERSQAKAQIKQWVSGFKKEHAGRAPTEEDKEVVRGLYEKYAALDATIQKWSEEGDGEQELFEAQAKAQAMEEEIDMLSAQIRELQAVNQEQKGKLGQAEVERKQLQQENQRLLEASTEAALVTVGPDAGLLLEMTRKLCRQRGEVEERVASAELKTHEAEQAAHELQIRVRHMEQSMRGMKQQMGADAAQTKLSQLESQVSTLQLQMQQQAVAAERREGELVRQGLAYQKKAQAVGEQLDRARDLLTRRGGDELAPGIVEAFVATQEALSADKARLEASLEDAEAYIERQRMEARRVVDGYQDYAGLLEDALGQLVSGVVAKEESTEAIAGIAGEQESTQEKDRLRGLKCAQMIEQVEQATIRVCVPAKASAESASMVLSSAEEHLTGFVGQKQQLRAELEELNASMGAVQAALKATHQSGWVLGSPREDLPDPDLQLAAAMRAMSPEDRNAQLAALPRDELAGVLAAMSPAQRNITLQAMSPTERSALLTKMTPEQRALALKDEWVNEYTPAVLALDVVPEPPDSMHWDTGLGMGKLPVSSTSAESSSRTQ